MPFTLRELAVFRSVAETHSVSRSAQALGSSVSSVSQTVKDLESCLGAKLFERRSSGMMLTSSGRTLLPYAVLILNKAREAESIFTEQRSGFAGSLVIGSNRNFGIYILSRRLPIFKLRRPAIETSLKVDDNEVIEAGVAGNSIDIGFVSAPPASPGLESFPCFDDRRCMVTGALSPLHHAGVLPQELSMATWILDDEAAEREAALRWLSERGIAVQNSLVMSTMGAIKRAVGTGLGAAVLPFLAVREEIVRGDLVELRTGSDGSRREDVRRIYAIYKPDRARILREIFFRECEIAPLTEKNQEGSNNG